MHPPAKKELEVTLLGRGVGECVVVHLLEGKWLVVDSFLKGNSTATPWYLDSMGVDPDAVETILVTHFHVDHYRGIDQLHDYYHKARLMITDALRSEHFLAIYSDNSEPGLLGTLPGTIKRASQRLISPLTPGLRHISAGQEVYRSHNVHVLALTPTDAAVQTSNQELGKFIGLGNRNSIRSQLRNDNRCSIVLHLTVGDICVLLCADLVADAPAYGWQAVLKEPNNATLHPASLMKVAHHGSVASDYSLMWDKLVGRDPVLTVAPYWPSGLPRPEDVARLRARGSLWQAAPSVNMEIDEFGNKISQVPKTGVIRARRHLNEKSWRVEAIPPAFKVP